MKVCGPHTQMHTQHQPMSASTLNDQVWWADGSLTGKLFRLEYFCLHTERKEAAINKITTAL